MLQYHVKYPSTEPIDLCTLYSVVILYEFVLSRSDRCLSEMLAICLVREMRSSSKVVLIWRAKSVDLIEIN